MIGAAQKYVTFGLAVLLMWLAAISLFVTKPAATHPSVAPCHHSVPSPSSSGSNNSDHSCCAAGHNQTLTSKRIEAPPLRLWSPIQDGAVPQTQTAKYLLGGTHCDLSPPLTSNSPIRI
jgi:hypothetical protein